MDKISEKLTMKLNEIRAQRGWSIAEMARRCDLSKSTMDGYLKGVSPSIEALEKISKGTSISIPGLLAQWTYTSDQSFRTVFIAARDELYGFFAEAVSSKGGSLIEISNGKVGGRTPDELAHKLALEIAINATGIEAYSQELIAQEEAEQKS